MNKEQDQPPDNEKPIMPDIPEAKGLKMMVQFVKEGEIDLDHFLILAEDDFPPFIICVFKGVDNVKFAANWPKCNISQRDVFISRLTMINEVDHVAQITALRQKQVQKGILRPGGSPIPPGNLRG